MKIFFKIIFVSLIFISSLSSAFGYKLTNDDYSKIQVLKIRIDTLIDETEGLEYSNVLQSLKKYINKKNTNNELESIIEILIKDLEYKEYLLSIDNNFNSYFGIDDNGLYYYDQDIYYKKYFSQFDTNEVNIITDRFFTYDSKLYSNYEIFENSVNNEINLVSSSVDDNSLNILNEYILFDKDNVYSINEQVSYEDGDLFLNKNQIIKDTRICLLGDIFINDIYYSGEIILNKSNLVLIQEGEDIIPYINGKKIINNDFDDISELVFLSDKYVKTKRSIYYLGDGLFFYRNISNVDLDSFEYIGGNFAKDKYHVFHNISQLDGLNVNTLNLINDNIISDGDLLYYNYTKIEGINGDIKVINKDYIVDDEKVYYVGFADGEVIGADPKTFEVIGDTLGIDKDSVYYWKSKIDLDPEKIKMLPGGYLIDEQNVYFSMFQIHGADPLTFKSFDFSLDISKDKNSVYYGTRKQYNIDPSTFDVLSLYFGYDKNTLYFLSGSGIKEIESYDGSNIEVVSSNSIIYKNSTYNVEEGDLYINGELYGSELMEETEEYVYERLPGSLTGTIYITDDANTIFFKKIIQQIENDYPNKHIEGKINKMLGYESLYLYENVEGEEEIFMNIGISHINKELGNDEIKKLLKSLFSHMSFNIDSELDLIIDDETNYLYDVMYYKGIVLNYEYGNIYLNSSIFENLKDFILSNPEIIPEQEFLEGEFSFSQLSLLRKYDLSNKSYINKSIKFNGLDAYYYTSYDSSDDNSLFFFDKSNYKDFESFYRDINITAPGYSFSYQKDVVIIYINDDFLMKISSYEDELTDEEIKQVLKMIYDEL